MSFLVLGLSPHVIFWYQMVFADSHPPPRSDSASLLSRAQVSEEVLQLHGTEREGAQEGGRGG